MRLIEEMHRRLDAEQSYFRQHLIREDIGRLEKLGALARQHPELGAFIDAARRIGWTPEDRRTHELKETLDPLLAAIHARLGTEPEAAEPRDALIARLWQAFEQHRMDRLVGCLARVPRPNDAAGA